MNPQGSKWKLSLHSDDSLSFVPHFVRSQDEVPAFFSNKSAAKYNLIHQRNTNDSIHGNMFVSGTVIEPPTKIVQAKPDAAWTLAVIVGLTILTSVSISLSFRRLAALIKATYSRRQYVIFQKNYNVFSDLATFVLVPVHAGCIALICILLLRYYNVSLIFGELLFFVFLSGGLIILRFIKVIIAYLLAFVFETKAQTRAYFENSYIYDSSSVFFLVPLCWLLLFSPLAYHFLFLGTIILVIINIYRFIMSIYNGIQNTGYSLFYFILYLCTVELLPLLLLVKLLKESNI